MQAGVVTCLDAVHAGMVKYLEAVHVGKVICLQFKKNKNVLKWIDINDTNCRNGIPKGCVQVILREVDNDSSLSMSCIKISNCYPNSAANSISPADAVY